MCCVVDKQIITLDIASLIAGAKFRGDFEERLQSIIREIQSLKNIILFVDEIHMVIGSGSIGGDSSMDTANILKPALARGDLRCIGCTTLGEYRRYIEKDKALERRFQKVMLSEPSVNDTISMLRGLREKYELHHGVLIQDAALVGAAQLSERYIGDRFLPDKAIDLIDEAASQVKIQATSKPEEIESLQQQVNHMKMERLSLLRDSAASRHQKRLSQLDTELKKLEEQLSHLNTIWNTQISKLRELQTLKQKRDELKLEQAKAER